MTRRARALPKAHVLTSPNNSPSGLITYQALKELADTLPQPPFLRIHKSYIVSLDKIQMVDGNTLYIADKQVSIQ
ncbi:LytTR family DNA-binding domain-containing protein [Hymenobacter sp. GOD-10R]|uniref:LytTR family DNA-binding domain-containing protein n=1 Tax=Hymenobacter sp. GOD-10R TaxID=3093922 RepID=UPI002D76675D|nr:LytTR family DNA-binding domain-containing protein [Hymenobacter sp. GOD-10R]WRQ30314.1 LytTR family DNA-binding domain-containing protein [Hymenobacter sp. GOD-10R]